MAHSQSHVHGQRYGAGGARAASGPVPGAAPAAAPAPASRPKVHILSNISLAGRALPLCLPPPPLCLPPPPLCPPPDQQSAASTAEILHSLSLAKVFSSPGPGPGHGHGPGSARYRPAQLSQPPQPPSRVQAHPKARHLFGDPATLNSGEDIVGTEERPSPSDSGLPYHYMILQRVMLDHTYAVTPQVAGETGTGDRDGVGVSSPLEPVVASPPSQVLGPPQHALHQPHLHQHSHSFPPPMSDKSDDIGSVIGTKIVRDDDAASVVSSVDGDDDPDRHDSDTETAPETEEDGKTRCVCEFTHDDGYMICCDRCGEWQHVDCMAIDRQNIPDDYMCDRCQPRLVDRKRARSIQMRKREELSGVFSSASDTSSVGSADQKGKRAAEASNFHKRTFTTYSRTIGGVSRTISSDASLHSLSPTVDPLNKKTPKRPKRIDNGKKVTKKKSPEKKLKRKSVELKNPRSKYSNLSNSHRPRTSDPYELAMTNHYSPELRARVARYCSNGTNSPSASSVLTAHHCATVPHAGSKILVATKDLKENSPIVELRGKYMLSDQHRPQPQSSGRTGNQRPGPFLFFYRLSKESTRVCVDTRTYGNEARFVRRSCKPNAELQHCVIKGTLHIYLVAMDLIHADTEITIKHDDDGNSQPCACGNPKFCKNIGSIVNKTNSSFEDHVHDKKGRTRLSNSAMAQSNRKRSPEKESPERCFSPKLEKLKSDDGESISEAIKQDLNEIFANIKEETPEKDVEEKDNNLVEAKEEPAEVKNVEMEIENTEINPEDTVNKINDVSAVIKKEDEKEKVIDLKCNEIMDSPKSKDKTVRDLPRVKESDKPRVSIPSRRSSMNSVRTTRSSAAQNTSESADEKSDSQSDSKSQSSKEKKVLTREERKLEAIMKAIERMEKAEQRRQENRDRQSKRRESDSKDCNDDNFEPKSIRKKKGRTQSTGQSQLNRNRMNSMDSDALTSGDENSSLILSPTRENFKKGSELMSPVHDSNSLDNSLDKMNVGLSSACLLVEAAVGPLETTFKLPKTKKTIMNEWLNKSPDINSSYDHHNQTENSSTIDNNNSSHHFVDKESFVGPKSIENLVKAANTMIGNMSGGVISVDSTPEKNYYGGLSESEDSPTMTQMSYVSRITRKILKEPVNVVPEKPKTPKKNRKGKVEDRFTNKRPLRSSSNRDLSPVKELLVSETTSNDTECPNITHPLQHSAKKRWLRQAISEESDSPRAESPPSEMLTPLKKRRLARESLSLETNNISLESTHSNPAQKENECHRSKQITDICNSDKPIIVNNCTVERLEPQIIENVADIALPPDPEVKKNNVDEPHDIEMKPIDDISNFKTNCILPKNEQETTTAEKVFENSPVKSVTHSTETSGNSSPILDEMDDIQKKIHSFHTENIQFLKIRNKKQPKEKRKKVNLNFDLCVLDDQTVSVKLKNEDDEENVIVENKVHLNSTDFEMKDVESEKVLNHTNETSRLNCDSVSDKTVRQTEAVVNNNSAFLSTPLFLNSFRGESQVNNETALVPDLDAIKNAIDKTTNLDTTIFENHLNSMDEYRNVQEILIRVNQMDSRNSVLLSGVLKDANHSNNTEVVKNFSGRQSDPRLNHPPPEKPKPTKRKLSIYEYRRRQSMASVSSLDASDTNPASDVSQSGQDSTSDTHGTPSPRDDINCTEKDLNDSVAELSRLSGLSEEHSAKLMSSTLPSDILGHDSNDVSSYSLYSNTNCVNNATAAAASQINLDR